MRVQTRRSLGRFVVIAVLAGIALASATAVLATHVFNDVSDGSVHRPGIEYMADAAITLGCGGGDFCPQDKLSREQMATFLYRSSGNDPATPPSVNADKVDGFDSSEMVILPSNVIAGCEAGDFPVLSAGGGWVCGFLEPGGLFAAGPGLTQSGILVSVDFDDTVSATGISQQVPRADHDHNAAYYTEPEVDTILADFYTQADVNTLLDLKSDVGHVHAPDAHNHDADYAAIGHNHDGAYAALGHNHDLDYYPQATVNTLLGGKSDTGHVHAPGAHNHDSDYLAITGTAANSQLLDNLDSTAFSLTSHNHNSLYAAIGHNHDSDYYPQATVDTLLAGKSDIGHVHAAVAPALATPPTSTQVGVAAATDSAVNVSCPGGTQLIGGGFSISPTSAIDVFITKNFPNGNTWEVHAVNNGGSTVQVTAHAICAPDS